MHHMECVYRRGHPSSAAAFNGASQWGSRNQGDFRSVACLFRAERVLRLILFTITPQQPFNGGQFRPAFPAGAARRVFVLPQVPAQTASGDVQSPTAPILVPAMRSGLSECRRREVEHGYRVFSSSILPSATYASFFLSVVRRADDNVCASTFVFSTDLARLHRSLGFGACTRVRGIPWSVDRTVQHCSASH